MEKLALLGGRKAISEPFPHWEWPPQSEDIVRALERYMKHGRYNKSGYPEIVAEFERNFAAYHQAAYALTTNSGTSALHAAFFAVGIQPGDEVLAPTLTFHSTVTPLFQLGAIPILCDCSPDTANVEPDEIEKRMTDNVRAVVVTHLWGHPCDMDRILDIAREYRLVLVEDCSHAHGAEYKGRKVGTFGDVACFSMDNKKIMASGEAGVLLTNKKEYFERALLYSDFGPRLENELTDLVYKKYSATGLGHKFRINPLAAVVANERLKNLDKYIQLRNEKLNYLSEKLKNIPGISPPVTKKYVTRGAFFGYKPFFFSKELGVKIESYIKTLQAEGMDIRQTLSPPLHLMPLFNERQKWFRYGGSRLKKYKVGDFPVCEHLLKNTLSLPTFTFEPYTLIDQYVAAFEKVSDYFKQNGPLPEKGFTKETFHAG
ncbi:DegT/DnrJ/EryC1/StrS family aminotransferase [candidate division KSB1 bacterium]|nr:DegT/DnrJ/EryC1/StrS family aminotransferase [candidate division KSB1 bacterium]